MKSIEQKYLDVLKKQGWAVCKYTNDGRVELKKYSSDGKDFTICVNVENLPKEVRRCAVDFSMDKYIEMQVKTKKNDVRNIPTINELLHDVEDINKMLQKFEKDIDKMLQKFEEDIDKILQELAEEIEKMLQELAEELSRVEKISECSICN